MPTLRVNNVLTDRILVSRESARLLEEPLRALVASEKANDKCRSGVSQIIVDFEGVQGVAPSFVDELITILDSLFASHGKGVSLIVANPPARLSLKFEAIARGHGMSVQVLENGSWCFSDVRHTGT